MIIIDYKDKMNSKSVFILLFVNVVVLLFGCNGKSDYYHIQGQIDGISDRHVYLGYYENGKLDTVAKTMLENGRFNFRGTSPEIIPVLLIIEGATTGPVIYLENMNYQIKLDSSHIYDAIVEGGGEAQALANQYVMISLEQQKSFAPYREHFRTLNMTENKDEFQRLRRMLDSLYQDADIKREALVRANPDSYLSMYLLHCGMKRLTFEELKERFSVFSEGMQKSFSGRKVADFIHRLEQFLPGNIAPDFRMQDIEGNAFTMSSVKGKVKLVDFWASWCAPCRASIPLLKKIYDKYHDKGFEILSVSLDESYELWKKALDEEKMKWKQGSDLKGWENDSPIPKLYEINGIPFTVLVDENNRILMMNPNFDHLDKILSEYLD